MCVFLGLVIGIQAMPLEGEYEDIVNAIESKLYGGRDDPHELPERVRQSGYNDWRDAFARQNDVEKMEGWDPVEGNEVVDVFNGRLDVVDEWPAEQLNIGQVGGLATDKEGHVNVFHRAEREWTDKTFDENNVYAEKELGPITAPAIVRFNKTNGEVIDKWGAGKFYMPHGLTICSEGHFWVTDVAMHQVFMYKKGEETPAMTLGVPFTPSKEDDADDDEHFCKPTDVAVAKNGDFFVADGYCNKRIIKYAAGGKEILGKFAVGEVWIPHSIALVEDEDLLCIADRENMRVLCYSAGLEDNEELGQLQRHITEDTMGRVFAVEYSEEDQLLYAVTGPTGGAMEPKGYSIDLSNDGRYREDIIATWEPDEQGFDQPHDLTVSPDGDNVYVGEIGPNVIWKFEKEDQ